MYLTNELTTFPVCLRPDKLAQFEQKFNSLSRALSENIDSHLIFIGLIIISAFTVESRFRLINMNNMTRKNSMEYLLLLKT